MAQTAQPCEAFGDAWEQTDQGTQVLISGVRAITDRDRLQLRAPAQARHQRFGAQKNIDKRRDDEAN